MERSQLYLKEINFGCAIPFTSTEDTEFGDCYFDISKTDKRLIRATVKTYERTGTYVFLKLFKKAESDYEFQQRVSLTVQEFENLIEKSADIRPQFTQEESTKPPPAKKNHDSNESQKKFRRPTPATKKVEAMYERSPNYFKQFQKQFKFQIVEEKLTLSNTNVYAVCAHFDSEFCGLVTNHSHVLLDTTTLEKETLKRNLNFPVRCIFTSFTFLFSTATTLETNGDVFTKLKLAVEFNSSADKVDSQTVRKQLPVFVCHSNVKNSNAKQVNMNQKPCAKMPVVAQKSTYNARPPSKQVQTNFVNSETIRRIENIFSGPHSGAFCQIMDIFVSGYGKLIWNSLPVQGE